MTLAANSNTRFSLTESSGSIHEGNLLVRTSEPVIAIKQEAPSPREA